MSEDAADGFLSRWSRRKRAAGRQSPGPAPAVVPEVPAFEVPVPEVPLPAAAAPGSVAVDPVEGAALPAFDPASLPAPETLTAASDISGFLRAEVPAALRQAALRRIWTLDTGIRDFIGPADYAWDYNAVDGVPGFALGLGGDVQKLLAQAMGWLPEADPAMAAVAEPQVDEFVLAETVPGSESSVAIDQDSGSIEEQPAATAGPAAENATPVAVRRHGGAMPA